MYDYVQTELRLRTAQLDRSWRPDFGYTLRYRTYPRASGFGFAEQLLSARSQLLIADGLSLELGSELGVRRYAFAASSTSPAFHQNQAQLSLSGGVTHELTMDTSLGMQYRWMRDVVGRGAELYEESDALDLSADHYSYGGQLAQFSVTRAAFAGISTTVGGKLDIRNYTSRLAFDMEGLARDGIMRRDTRRSIELKADKPLALGTDGRLKLLLKWRYTDVDSNDPYYDAPSQRYSTALNLSF